MNKLSNWLVERIIDESKKIQTIIAIYTGRFQPFSKHHYETFKSVQSKFGKENSYIATTNVTGPDSPFSFNEKKKIINSYGISNVVKVTSPYSALEILSKYDPKTTAVVFIVGEKDSSRLRGNYWIKYNKSEKDLSTYEDNGYFLVVPHVSLKVKGYGEMSGTTVRKALGNKSIKNKESLFKDIFGFYDKSIYNLVVGKLEKINEDVIPGGKSDFKSLEDIAYHHVDPKGYYHIDNIKDSEKFRGILRLLKLNLRRGIEVEMEHTSDEKIAKEIAYDHLYEDPEYYTKLNKIHTEAVFTKDWWKNFLTEGTVEHSEYELKKAGLLDKDSDYGGMIGKAVLELMKVFASQGHSGMSAAYVRDLFNKLSNYQTLTPITSDPEEWNDVSEYSVSKVPFWQNKRNPATFSKDGGKTWYNLDEQTILKGIKIALKEYKKLSGQYIINESKNIKNSIELNELMHSIIYHDSRQLLLCGGAAGHMQHIFENNELTFGDIKSIIDLSLQGKLDIEKVATEKTDGFNLFITWQDGKLKAARNKTQIKSPINIKQVESMFSGRGVVKDAFVFAMMDLESAIGSLSEKQKIKIFNNGQNFMNIEIIYPETENVINYDTAVIQFHGAASYDSTGTQIQTMPEFAGILSGMIKQVNQDVQSKFKIIPPNILKMNPHQDYSKKRTYFLNKLKKLQSQFNLKDTDQLSLYHQSWWENFINEKTSKMSVSISNIMLMGLVKRWAFKDKEYSISRIKSEIKNQKFLDWVIEFDKQSHEDQVKKNMYPFEMLIMELGVEVLKNIEGVLASNPDSSIQKMKAKVNQAIQTIQSSGDVNSISAMKGIIKRIESLGGFQSIVPIEGIVFTYKGQTWKITGIFPQLNKLMQLSNIASK